MVGLAGHYHVKTLMFVVERWEHFKKNKKVMLPCRHINEMPVSESFCWVFGCFKVVEPVKLFKHLAVRHL